MRKHLSVVLFIISCGSLFAQTSSNPFDLKYRPSRPLQTPPPSKPIVSADTAHALIDNSANSSKINLKEDTSIINIGRIKADTLANNPFELDAGTDSATGLVPSPAELDTAKNDIPSLVPPVLIKNSSKGFQIFFLLFSLLLLIFIVNVERNFVRDLWRVISNENYGSLHHRNQRNTMRQILLMMGYAVFIFQAGIFIFHALRIYHYQGPVRINIWIPMLLVTGIYIVRHAVVRYLRWLFNNQKEMSLFGFDISIFNTMVGLILLPINGMLLFGPESIYKPLIIIGIITFIAAYFLRQLRWALTARGLIVHSLFLFFVYLCAVEILPLWALSTFFW